MTKKKLKSKKKGLDHLKYKNTAITTVYKRRLRGKHATTTLQATFLHLSKFPQGKGIHLHVHLLFSLVCDIKGKTKQTTAIQKEFSQSCVKTCCV